MELDYPTLEGLRRHHPGWRLLTADHAPLIASFLYEVFITPNCRSLPRSELEARLEDRLYQLRESLGEEAFPKEAGRYLDDWAEDERGWLRSFYPPGSDEPHYDLTPATEKAVGWLASLGERSFVGTESRLLTVFDLLRQMVEGSETDPAARIAELERRRKAIDDEIARIAAGELPLLDETALRDRFQQAATLARALLADFREVEHNFRRLDRSVRERIALWEGAKGELLEDILDERDAIADSDQGRSFRAFWEFLMSPARQEELTEMLEAVFALPAIAGQRPDDRLRRIHYDWLEAGEHTQRTVARLSQQLRRYLDDQTWHENRRIMQRLHAIEGHALQLRDTMPKGDFMTIDRPAPAIELPMERPLFRPPLRPVIAAGKLTVGDDEVETESLFSQVYVDRERLAANVRRALHSRHETTLCEVLADTPLEQGLAELVTYIALASDWPETVIDEDHEATVCWRDGDGHERRARLPRIVFKR